MQDLSSYLHPIGLVSAAIRLYKFHRLHLTDWHERCLSDALRIQNHIYRNTCKALNREPYTEHNGIDQ